MPRFLCDKEFSLTAGYDLSPVVRESVRNSQVNMNIFNNVNELIDSELDLVVICSPNSFHIEHACLALERGISVLIEKPVCLSRIEFYKLKEASLNSSALCLVSNAMRFREDVRLLTQESRLIGNEVPELIEVEWIRSEGIPNPGSWFTNASLSGGGVLNDLGWHMIDIACSLNDYALPISACAMKSNLFLKTASNQNAANWRKDLDTRKINVDVEDTLYGLIHTDSGCCISIRVAWSSNSMVDQTLVKIHKQGQSIELSTTFGFSENRISKPSIKIHKCHEVRELDYPNAILGAEYSSVISEVKRALNNKKQDNNVFDEIEAVQTSIGMLYQSADALSSLKKVHHKNKNHMGHSDVLFSTGSEV